MTEPAIKRHREKLKYVALTLLIAALLLMTVAGMQLAGLAFLVASMFAWDRPFEENRAKGKRTFDDQGRVAMGIIMVMIGCVLIYTHEEGGDGPSEPLATFASSDALSACEDGVKQRVAHPSTVDMAAFTADFNEHGDGRSSLVTTFTAKNSFNLELEFQARCLFSEGRLTHVGIAER